MPQPEEVTNESMYCLFAPDGTWQPTTLSHDYAACVAFVKLLHKAKMGKSFFELTQRGFEILPVTVTTVVTGSAEDAFKKAKAAL